MPIARVQLEDGRIARFEVPEGTTPEQVTAYAQQQFSQPAPKAEPAAPGLAQGLTQSAARGASFGFSDRLGALASSLIGGQQDAGEYGNYGGTYSENLKSLQADAGRFNEAHPVLDTVANIAGSLATGIPAAKALSAIKPLSAAFQAMRPWQQYASSGALAGSIAGAGNAAPGEMGSGALSGAGIGAALGTTAPPLLKGGLKVVDALIGTPLRAAANAFRTPEEQGTRLLAKSLARDEVSAAQLAKTLKDMGSNATVADAAGRNTLELAKYSARTPGIAKNAGLDALEARAKTAGGRVMQSLGQAVGVKTTNFHGLVKGLHGEMRKLSPGYESALSNSRVPTTEALAILKEDPIIQRAIGAAKQIVKTDSTLSKLKGNGALDAFEKELASIEITPAQTIHPFGLKTPLAGTEKVALQYENAPTLRTWDYVKRGVDSIIDENTDAITGKMTNLGRQAAELKRALLGELDNVNPDYAAIRGQYADKKSAESALGLGRAFLREDAEVTLDRISDMTPAERKYFMAGAARAIQDKIMGAPDTGMAYAQFINRPGNVDKLQAAFGNEPGFAKFMKSLENEVKMGKTHARLVGGSDTAANAMVAQDVGAPIGSQIPTSKEQLLRAGLNYLTKPSDEVSAQLFNSLLSNNPAKQAEVIRALQGLDAKMSQNLLDPRRASQLGLGLNALAASQFSR